MPWLTSPPVLSTTLTRHYRLLCLVSRSCISITYLSQGTERDAASSLYAQKTGHKLEATDMNGLIYLIGLIVVIMAILSFFGLR